MQLKTPLAVADLAQRFGLQLLGRADLAVTGISELHHAQDGDLIFVDHPKYYDKALQSAASAILIDQDVPPPAGKCLLVTPTPFAVYNELVREARPATPITAPVSSRARIGAGTHVEPGAIIDAGVVIGADCYIAANAVIRDGTRIGDRVRIQSGAVIGSEAFYFRRTPEGYEPWHSGGHVVIEDDVDIGPNCTIARGVSSATHIGRGTKLDSQVQIGHDVKVGAHCLLAAQVGIAGNTTVGEWCILQGQVGIAQNLTIGPRCIILAKSGVSKSLESGREYFGYPAQEARTAFKELALLRRLRKG
jgi:UDP-3-O-[3-hydroxymyristoyl] glucosamine N-acyltransferase